MFSSPCERRLNPSRDIAFTGNPAALSEFGLRPVALRLTLSGDLPFRRKCKEQYRDSKDQHRDSPTLLTGSKCNIDATGDFVVWRLENGARLIDQHTRVYGFAHAEGHWKIQACPV
jgi:hypothetical protein